MTEKKKELVFLAICFGLTFLIYSQSLFGGFVFDDHSIIEHWSLFKDINNLPQVATMAYWTAEAGLYRPVTVISYALNYVFFGSSPWSFHLVNLVFYALTGYLLFLLIRKIFPQKKLLASLTAVLFLVLPIHTEAVANIVGRAEILALFFSLLAFLEIVKRKANPWLAGLWFILALGSKETALATLPIACLIVFYKKFFPKKPPFTNKYLVKSFSPVFVLIASLAVYLTARFLVLGQYFLSNNASLVENPLKFASFWSRIATALKILVLYLRKSFWPFGLCSDYSYNQIPLLTDFLNSETLLGLVILLFLMVSLIIFLGRAPILALGSAFFLFSFLPIANLIFPIGTIAGERLIYFPSIGLCLYLAQGLIFLKGIKPKKIFSFIAIGLSIGLLCFYAAVSFIRNFDWLTEKRLFISAAQCAHNSVLSRSNMGTVYYFEGNYDEAEKEILAAHQIYDKYSKAINNLGLVYWKKGQYEQAKEQYFRAIKNWPPYQGVYENLALLELSQGKEEQAKKWLKIFFAGNQELVKDYLRSYFLAN